MSAKSFMVGICITLLCLSIGLLLSEGADAKSNEISGADTSGSLGDNIRWMYDAGTEEMVVSGYGEMYFISDPFFSDWLKSNSVSVLKFMGSDMKISRESFANFKCDEIIIGEGVVSIDQDAFLNTTATSITIPSTVTSIGYRAFCGSDVVNLTINARYWGGDSAYSGCNDLKNIIFGPQVKGISSMYFADCNSIESITYPSTIETILWYESHISYYPFENISTYSELTSVTLKGFNIPIVELGPKVVSLTLDNTNTTKLGFGSSNLEFLRLVNLPNLVELDFGMIDPSSMGTFNLSGMSTINTISVSDSNPNAIVIDNVLYSKDGRTLYYYPEGLTSTEFTIPSNVTEVYNITNNYLKSIEFHDSLESCGLISGDSLLCLNIPGNIMEGIYSPYATYNSLKIVMMPTQFHYSGSDNDHTIVKYYSKYIDKAYASVDSEGKVFVTVENVSGYDYPFRIGVQYNESNILPSSTGTVELSSDYIYYSKLYLSIESGESEDSNEWVPSDRAESGKMRVIVAGIVSIVLILAGIFLWRPLRYLGIIGLFITGLLWFGSLIGIS